MVEVKRAKYLGTCFGVERALKRVKEIAQKNEGKVYTIGPLIHNPVVVEELKRDFNLMPISSPEEIDGGTLIIRTHGIDPKVIKMGEERGLKIIDLTCPFVKRVHELARNLVKEGYTLIIIGEKEHPEVKGIQANVNNKGIVIGDLSEVKGLPFLKKIGVVFQTTQDINKSKEIVSNLITKSSEIRIYNTICSATSRRQEAAIELAREVDLMVVVGGKNSGNTRRLVSICKEIVDTIHVEDREEIEKKRLEGIRKIGITAGASTPSHIIERVIERIKELADKADF